MKQFVSPTFDTYRIALEEGRIKPIEALLRWTYVAMSSPVTDLEKYILLVVKTLPNVDWLEPGEEFEVRGKMPVYWTCEQDFYEWADGYLGHVFTLGKFILEHIEEHEPEQYEQAAKRLSADAREGV